MPGREGEHRTRSAAELADHQDGLVAVRLGLA